MQVYTPLLVVLDSSTADASTYAEWSSATAYVAGDNVKVTTAVPHHEYRALQSGTNKPPADYPDYWLDLGVTNPYRMLDSTVSTRSTATTTFSSVLTVTGTPSHLTLFGLDSVLSVRVQIEFDGTEVFDELYPLSVIRETGSWWEFFFGTRDYQTSLIQAIGGWYDATVTLTFTGDTGSTIGVGHCVLTQAHYLGETMYGVDLRMTQYSTKEEDGFGNKILVPRANAKVATAKLVLSESGVDRCYRILEALDATPCAWDLNNSGSNFDSFRIWGIADFRVLLQEVGRTYCELDVEGLI
jgi:hypothetical protein